MKRITLSVQYQGRGKSKRWRLGMPVFESKFYFKERGKSFNIKIPSEKQFTTHTKCGCYDFSLGCQGRKKGYDIYDIKIHEWIENSGYVNPDKLIFRWDPSIKLLRFIKPV